jgi:hypothetical protein
MEEAGLKSPEHRAHEAMSRAVKRVCPHCDQEYVKGDGCNAIRCKCGKLSCYLCGQKIENHSHFGRDKCEMFTRKKPMAAMNEKKRQEAGRKVLAEAGITDEEKILAILASPPKGNLGQKKAAIPAQLTLPAETLVVARPRQRLLEAPAADVLRRLNEQMEQIQELGFRAARARRNEVLRQAGGREERALVGPQAQAVDDASVGGFRFGDLLMPNQVQPAAEGARRNARREERRAQPVSQAVELPRLAERLEQIRVDLEARRRLAERLEQIRVDLEARRNARREEEASAAQEPANRLLENNALAGDQPQRQHEVLAPERGGGWWYIPFLVLVAFCLGIAMLCALPAQIQRRPQSILINSRLLVIRSNSRLLVIRSKL